MRLTAVHLALPVGGSTPVCTGVILPPVLYYTEEEQGTRGEQHPKKWIDYYGSSGVYFYLLTLEVFNRIHTLQRERA